MQFSKNQYYHKPIQEGNLEFSFISIDSIGIKNLVSGNKTTGFIEFAQTFFDNILIQSESKWGVLNKELQMILPPVFNNLYPVVEIDLQDYLNKFAEMSLSATNQISEDQIESKYFMCQDCFAWQFMEEHLGLLENEEDLYDEYDSEYPKDRIFEVVDLEKVFTKYFIGDYKNEYVIVSLETGIVESFQQTTSLIYNITQIQKGLFLCKDTQTYKFANLIKNRFFHTSNDFSEYFFFDKDYIAIRYLINKIDPDDDITHETASNAKWGLFKRNTFHFYSIVFDMVTDFIFDTIPEQTDQPNTFICTMLEKAFIVQYNEEKKVSVSEDNYWPSTKKTEKYLKLLSQYKSQNNKKGFEKSLFRDIIEVSMSPKCTIKTDFYYSIKQRTDGMYDIQSEEGKELLSNDYQLLSNLSINDYLK